MNRHDELSAHILSQADVDRMFAGLMNDIRRRQRTRTRHHIALAAISVLALGGLSTAGTFLYLSMNSSGQTYGPVRDAPVNTDPDLILAVGDEGVSGYILASDLNGPEFASPDEVSRWLEEHPPDQDRVIPLYESDGKTVIGTFTINAAKVVSPGDSEFPEP